MNQITDFIHGLLAAFRPSQARSRAEPASSSPPRTGAINESAQAAYLGRVVVRNLKVGKSVLGESGVFGEVKNTGERTLKEVEITIYCLGRDGEAIFEKTYHPVLVSELSFGDASQPLKPGYSRGFGVKLDDAPSEWAKKVSVRVTRVEFQ